MSKTFVKSYWMNKQIISIEKKNVNQKIIIKLVTIMLVLHILCHNCLTWQTVIGYLSLSHGLNIFFTTHNLSCKIVVTKCMCIWAILAFFFFFWEECNIGFIVEKKMHRLGQNLGIVPYVQLLRPLLNFLTPAT